jgi:hypothetical protein
MRKHLRKQALTANDVSGALATRSETSHHKRGQLCSYDARLATVATTAPPSDGPCPRHWMHLAHDLDHATAVRRSIRRIRNGKCPPHDVSIDARESGQHRGSFTLDDALQRRRQFGPPGCSKDLDHIYCLCPVAGCNADDDVLPMLGDVFGTEELGRARFRMPEGDHVRQGIPFDIVRNGSHLSQQVAVGIHAERNPRCVGQQRLRVSPEPPVEFSANGRMRVWDEIKSARKAPPRYPSPAKCLSRLC